MSDEPTLDEPTLDPAVLDADVPVEANPADVLEQRQEVPPDLEEELVTDDDVVLEPERMVDDRRGLGGWQL